MNAILTVKTKKLLLDKFNSIPQIAIITGSGIKLFRGYNPSLEIKYSDLPIWSISEKQRGREAKKQRVKGHEGILKLYKVKNKDILVFSGRHHLYEGFSINEVVTNVRLTYELGIKKLIITNAAGGTNKKIKEGDLLLITGFINLLQGTERGTLSAIIQPPFKIKSKLTSHLSRLLCKRGSHASRAAGPRFHLNIKKGIYAANAGPSYETFSEIKLLSLLGVSAVGMSTVPEIIAANSLGLDYAAISIITNVWDKDHTPTHSKVLRNVTKANNKLEDLILKLL